MARLVADRRPVKSRDLRWVFAAAFAAATLVLIGWEVVRRLV